MRLTLKSLQTEMHDGFNGLSLRIDKINEKTDKLDERFDKLDINVNERIDRVLLMLDNHIKETAHNFRTVDERFNEIDRRFDRLPGELMEGLSPYFHSMEKMLANHENRITVLEHKH